MIVLHIDSSASGSASVSRQLSAAAVETLHTSNENVQVKYRDLATNPPAHLSGELLSALRALPGGAIEPGVDIAAELALTETFIDELLQADVLVLGVPMYNFSIPSPLKAWIDRVAQPGRTFRYTEKGPVGLAGGKKALIISSRGSAIASTPMEAALDHQEAYLKTVMQFIGITDVKVVRAEGLSLGAESRKHAMERALAELQVHDEALA
jgi:FMN-dependent NADH-azoreductase